MEKSQFAEADEERHWSRVALACTCAGDWSFCHGWADVCSSYRPLRAVTPQELRRVQPAGPRRGPETDRVLLLSSNVCRCQSANRYNMQLKTGRRYDDCFCVVV